MATSEQYDDQEFREEYKYFSSDVKRVIISNILILILILGAYFANKNTGFIDKILRFF